MPPNGPALSCLDTLCCPEADGPTNLEQPTLNHVHSDTKASAVLADPTRAIQGTNLGSGPAMEASENDVGSPEQLLLYADEHYLAGKLPLGDHLGKVLHGVEGYHQRNVGPLRFNVSQLKWTGYHRLWPPRPLHQLYGQCDVEQCGGNCTAHQGASTLVHGYLLSPKQTGIHH
ncbi:15-hydroxyprostaglandin dehydrogenase [Trichonephila clavipes]|nr:15-hydroxyprostaglandin dehydrogenase [Trichonephila clavipes]